MFSDYRLKTDVRWITKSPTGINVYQFRYAGGGPLYQGVIAQELLDTHPDAVVTMPGGYYGVLYERIDVDFIQLPEPGSSDGTEKKSLESESIILQ